MRRWTTMAAVLAACTVVAACGSTAGSPGLPTVPLTVRSSLSQVVAAFVPVTVQGHRYAFRVDSGAGRSVIDLKVAESLHLPTAGPPVTGYTIGCPVTTEKRRITSWSLAGHPLSPQVVGAQTLSEASSRVGGLPVGGLLGADVLASFRSVQLDFRNKKLTLGATPPAGVPTIPLSVVTVNEDVIARASLTVASSPSPTEVTIDTGASLSFLGTPAAQALGVTPAGPPVTVRSIDCSATAQQAPLTAPKLGGVPITLPHVLVGTSQLTHVPAAGGGIIGEDALGRGGSLWLDFADQRLVLGAPPGS